MSPANPCEAPAQKLHNRTPSETYALFVFIHKDGSNIMLGHPPVSVLSFLFKFLVGVVNIPITTNNHYNKTTLQPLASVIAQ